MWNNVPFALLFKKLSGIAGTVKEQNIHIHNCNLSFQGSNCGNIGLNPEFIRSLEFSLLTKLSDGLTNIGSVGAVVLSKLSLTIKSALFLGSSLFSFDGTNTISFKSKYLTIFILLLRIRFLTFNEEILHKL